MVSSCGVIPRAESSCSTPRMRGMEASGALIATQSLGRMTRGEVSGGLIQSVIVGTTETVSSAMNVGEALALVSEMGVPDRAASRRAATH